MEAVESGESDIEEARPRQHVAVKKKWAGRFAATNTTYNPH